MPNQAETEQTNHAAAAAQVTKLPPFSTSDPLAWFFRAETLFWLRHIITSNKQSDLVLESLPDDVFGQMSDWLMSFSGNIPYDQLKAGLLERFSLTPSARARRIIASSSQPIGDQRAHSSWNEFQALARLPADTNGESKSLDMLRELWLLKLPATVRAAIPEASTMMMKDLLSRVVGLLDSNNALTHIQSAFTTTHEEESIHDESAAALNNRRIQTQRYQPTSRRREATQPKVCYYHSRFGQKARKCEQPSTFPKNLQDGHQ